MFSVIGMCPINKIGLNRDVNASNVISGSSGIRGGVPKLLWSESNSDTRSGRSPREFLKSLISSQRCPKNPDRLYDRRKILEQFDDILKTSIPEYIKYQSISEGFFVYDLTDPSNKYTSLNHYAFPGNCINLINNHIYHFSVVYFPFSQSHIAILEDGKLKVFRSINCKGNKEKLDDVVSYVEEKLKNGKSKDQTLTRLKNYRRYGFYRTTDERKIRCNAD